jgi:hypothetical protein
VQRGSKFGQSRLNDRVGWIDSQSLEETRFRAGAIAQFGEHKSKIAECLAIVWIEPDCFL